ncbi:MAG: N-acetylmuramoyl-L-alanine amidase [Alphaproteobacteria bacterium]|nr:N-acetylmuramoyl-L-alanine amidase [Alphaproteobacteria bacterium]MCB9793593.1 N-acetylmuramoyl-L-alanine amidase [Alphaproteobacteria bacterium]
MLYTLCALALAEQPPWPTTYEDPETLRADWSADEHGLLSPVRAFEDGGVRVGAILSADAPVQLYAQGVDGNERGPWVLAEEIWTNGLERVYVAELGAEWPEARVRLEGEVLGLAWELRHPVNEPRAPEDAPPPPPSVSSAQQAIGVISRESWGAQSTRCTSTEDDWYRMAIHHTAGVQTSGGTVQGAVQALQAYALGGSTYCDIPYQFLVGYDGSLWEGRPLAYTSGATGGGNNPGNIAICFMGCYHPSGCSTSHAATDAMMDWAGLLTRTLAWEHGVSMDSDSIRGHRDWPDNATACPGDYVHARLDELRQALPPYAASLVSVELPAEVYAGETTTGWITLRNDGHRSWSSDTKLAPTPRDVASPLASPDWLSPTRLGAPESSVAPGATGRFPLSVTPPAAGDYRLELTLVQEWVTWFADLPLGGSTGDAAFVVDVHAVDAPVESPVDSDPVADDSDDDPGHVGASAGDPPGRRALLSGFGCASAPGGGWWWLAGLALLRRRQRAFRVTIS